MFSPTWQQIEDLLTDGLHAIDLETTGLDATDSTVKIVGIGIANSKGVFYVDLLQIDHQTRYNLYSRLATLPLVAFNVFFDGAFLWRDVGGWLNWQGCALVLFKMLSTEGWFGQSWGLNVAIKDVLGWPESNKDDLSVYLKKHKLAKAQMSELATLEPEAFGEYCALDAEAAYQLWNYLNTVCLDERFEVVKHWHQQEFLTSIRLLIEQQFYGIRIDEPALDEYMAKLNQRIADQENLFLSDMRVQEFVKAQKEKVLAEHKAKEPPKLTKTGKISVRWEKWLSKQNDIVYSIPFNVNSKPQLAELFYDNLFETKIVGDKLLIETDEGTVETELTAGGGRPVHKKLLPRLGGPGKMLAEYNRLVKEDGYVRACKEKLRDGIIHPQFRPHGTITGRLGGSGGLNLQQLPKSREYLECWRARPGHKIIQLDFSALEPVVLANASKDPTLMRLYGPDQAPNDVYLYNAAHISAFKDKIRSYYDPYNPTKESIASAKKECKKERAANKVVHLAKQYGAGANRIWHILRENKVFLDIKDVYKICEEWDELYAGTKKFEQKLKYEVSENNGIFYNLLQRPLAVHEDKLRDVLNTYCQSSGHDILMKYLCLIDLLREERSVTMKPWILDFHDEVMFEAPDDHVESAVKILQDALQILNEELAAIPLVVPLTGDVEVVDTLAQIKCE